MVGDYYYGTGRRKSAVARVFLKPGKGQFVVNGKPVMRAAQVLPFEWLPLLVQLLRPHPDVRLIVHSSVADEVPLRA